MRVHLNFTHPLLSLFMNTRKPNKPFKSRKEDILRLRKKGLSYRQIAKKLGCSRGTISYHCGLDETQRQEKNARSNNNRSVLAKKVDSFKSRCTRSKWRTFRNKVKGFKAKDSRSANTYRINNLSHNFTAMDVVDKIGDDPICYLTGRKIDLNKSTDYSLDHIVPTILGGTNDLSNLGICCVEANNAKAGLSLEDFYSLCEEILAWRDRDK